MTFNQPSSTAQTSHLPSSLDGNSDHDNPSNSFFKQPNAQNWLNALAGGRAWDAGGLGGDKGLSTRL